MWKRPISVLVMVCTENGQVLLLERTQPVGFWQSVTGSLKWGESAVQAARRELYEETGLLVGQRLIDLHESRSFPIVPAWRARYAPSAYSNTEHAFMVRLPSRRLIRLNAAEHRRFRWLSAERAAVLASSWTNREVIARYA